MESFWRINVAAISGKNWDGTEDRYVHFFKVDVSGCMESGAKAVFNELKERFPMPDFKVTVTYWNIGGSNRDW